MKYRLSACFLGPLMIVLIIIGCGPSMEQAKKTYDLAYANLEAARKLAETDRVQNRHHLAVSESSLSEARQQLQKKRADFAYQKAAKSLTHSQKFMITVYKNNIAPLARDLKKRIERIDDKENPLKDPKITDTLDKVIRFSESLPPPQPIDEISREGIPPETEEMIASLARTVIHDFAEVTEIKQFIDETTTLSLESDVSFDVGAFHLSKKGRLILDEFCLKILSGRTYNALTVHLKIVGYTDQLGFNETGKTYKRLMRDTGGKAPKRKVARRKFLNKKLSRLRAENVGRYLESRIRQSAKPEATVTVHLEVIGRGEEKTPAGVPEPASKTDAVEDPRRRVVKIYVSMTFFERTEIKRSNPS